MTGKPEMIHNGPYANASGSDAAILGTLIGVGVQLWKECCHRAG